MALAVGAIVAGFVGIPSVLSGGNAIEHFLEPSFTASVVPESAAGPTGSTGAEGETARAGTAEPGAAEVEAASTAEELGLMGFSVMIAAIGILLARKMYVTSPEIADQMAQRFAGGHRVLSNKYYVDEVYNATVISGTMAGGRGLWAFDRHVVDGAVNGAGWVTVISSWFSGYADWKFVDGLVNFVGRFIDGGSYVFRRVQTGLVQNYALLMLFGIFAFLSIYLYMRISL